MKKTPLLLLALALLLGSLSASAQNVVDKQGRRQGPWVRLDKDGSVIFSGRFVDGLEVDTFTYFYHDGTVRLRNIYRVPGEVCSNETFDEQGRLMARGTYNKRNRDGLWEFFAPDGHLLKEARYNMGVKEGLHVVFNANGDTAELTTWHNNHRHGRWWKRLGPKAYITATYVNGGIEGWLTEFDDAGLLVREIPYENGLRHGKAHRFDAKGITTEEVWYHGYMTDRAVRINDSLISVHSMVCLAPQGKARTVVVLRSGEKIVCTDNTETVYDRIGDANFGMANHKGRVLVSMDCVQGLGKDAEGRDILILDPQPDFPIFPDEDGLRMARSAQYQQDPPLLKLN